MTRDLAYEIRRVIPDDRVHDHPALVASYAVDASYFEPRAKLVVDVESLEDVAAVLSACTRHGVGVTFRGSGTAVSGQACGDGVIVRLVGSLWNRIDILDDGARFWAGSSLVGAEVNVALAPYKRKMGADPASITSATMGGIVADNSAGMCCMVEENCYHAVRGMRFMLADGTYVDTTDEKCVADFRSSHAKLLQSLADLREKILAEPDVVERIRRKYSIKNTIGYTVNSFVDHEDPVDILMHLMIGSEGTLGFIHETLMVTIPTPPVRATGLMLFPSLRDASDAVVAMKESCSIEAAEIFDYVSAQAMQTLTYIPDSMKNLPEGACVMLIETKAWNAEELQANMDAILEVLDRFPSLSKHEFSTDEAECVSFWNVRRGLYPAIANYREPDEYVLTEDINIPVERLAEGCQDFQDLFDKYGYTAGIMGHAFHGNLHFSIPVKIADPDSVERLDHFMVDLVELITGKYDGSLKAEHGTGRAMAPFVRREWGDFLFEVMREVKRLLDPETILNPGILINEDPRTHIDGLKAPVAIHPSVDLCVDCGFCQQVCPSKHIGLNPRQRISLARFVARMRQDGKLEQADDWENIFVQYGEQLCATDGLCTTKCPVGADVASFIRDYRGRNASLRAGRMAQYVTDHFGGVLKGASLALGGMSIAHRIIGDAAMSKLADSARSVSGRRLPQWNTAMPRGGSAIPEPSSYGDGRDRVVYFPSCAVRSMGPGKDDDSEPLMDVTVKLLERAGYEVVMPHRTAKLCCGKALETKGFATQADALSSELNEALLQASEHGKYPVLCDTSPCLARMKKTLDQRMTLMDPIEFMMTAAKRLTFRKLPKTVALHPTCSTRTMGLADMFAELAGMCAQKVVVPTGVNCCGFSGDKGFHHPELNASALAGLREQVAQCDEGYSVSRTCEIGLTLHGGIRYRNVLYLVEEATR